MPAVFFVGISKFSGVTICVCYFVKNMKSCTPHDHQKSKQTKNQTKPNKKTTTTTTNNKKTKTKTKPSKSKDRENYQISLSNYVLACFSVNIMEAKIFLC